VICREYTNDYCEFDEPSEKGFDLFFEDYDALLKYVKRRFKTWSKYASTRDEQISGS
jgi:hypothetical protein